MKLTLIFLLAFGYFLLNIASGANRSSGREAEKSAEKKSARNDPNAVQFDDAMKAALLKSSSSSRASGGRRERTRSSSPAGRRRKSGEERKRRETRGDRTPSKSGRRSSSERSLSKTPEKKDEQKRASSGTRKKSESRMRKTERKSGRRSGSRRSSSRTPQSKEQQRNPSGTRKKSDGRHKENVERKSGGRKLAGSEAGGKAHKSSERRKSQIEASGRRLSSSRGKDAANKFENAPRKRSTSSGDHKNANQKSGGKRKSTTARKRSPSVGRTSTKKSRGRTPTRREPLKEVESSKVKTEISGENIRKRSKTPLARSESLRQRSSSSGGTEKRSKSSNGEQRKSRHQSGGGGRRREHSSVSSSRRRDGGGGHKSKGRRHSSRTRRSHERRSDSRRSRHSRSHSRHSSSRIGEKKHGEGKKMSADAILQINEIWNKFVEDFGENFCREKIAKGKIVDTIRDSLRKKADKIEEFFVIFDRNFVKNAAMDGLKPGGEIFKQFFRDWRQKISEKKDEFEPKVKAKLLLYGIAGALDSTIKLLILDYGHLMANEAADPEDPFDWGKHRDIERRLALLQQIMDVHESMARGFEPTKYMDQKQAIALDKFIQERIDYSQPL